MLAPALTAHTDLRRHHVAVSVSGPLTTADHGAALVTGGSRGIGLATARAFAAAGHRVAFVCSELILRSELILGDLDMLAPVLQADEQALPLVGYAA